MSVLYRRRQSKSSPLRLDLLEARDVPAVDLLNVPDADFASNKPLFVPITVNQADGPVSYSVTSNNSDVSAEVLTGGRSVQLNVSGTDSSNTPFSGTITIRLFEDEAPLSTSNIVTLVNDGYYNGKTFHRVINDFVMQGGSPNGDGQGGSNLVNTVVDEFNPQYTFASRGIVAMANSGDDSNNAQFFITDPFTLDNGTEVPAPLARRSEFLNFNYTIVGIMTSGFDVYQKIMDVPKMLGSDGAISQPVNPVTITSAKILDTNLDGVVKVTANGGFLGSAGIQVTATQGASQQSKSFTVTSVTDTVNDPPFLGTIANPTTPENTAVSFSLPFTELNASDKETFAVGRVVTTANGPVFTSIDATQGTATVDSSGKVTFAPATGFTGTVQLTVGVRDQQDRIGSTLGLNDARNFDTQKLNVTVSSTNLPPTISGIANQILGTGQSATVNFTVGDTETAPANLTVTATSSNTALVPLSNLVFGGSGANRTLTATPVAGQTGSTVITITVADASNATATSQFTLTALANQPPTISGIPNQISNEAAVGPLSFTVGDAETPAANLTLSATSSNPLLLPVASIVFGGSDTNRTVTLTPATGQFGFSVVTLIVKDADGISASTQFTLNVPAPATVSPSLVGYREFAVGSDIGGGSAILYNLDGSVRFRVTPYEAGFTGGIRTAAADFSGDGVADLAVASGPGRPGNVRIYDGVNETVLFDFSPFGDDFTRGINIAAGDITGDGKAEIVISADSGGGARLRVFTPTASGFTQMTDFIGLIGNDGLPDTTFRGGARAAVGDVDGDGFGDLIFAAGAGGGPRIAIFNGKTLGLTGGPKLRGDFFAFEPTLRDGTYVAAGDFNGDGKADLVAGAGPGGGPRVSIFDGSNLIANNLVKIKDFFAGDINNRGGIRVAVKDLDNDSKGDLVVGAGPGGSHVTGYSATQIALPTSATSFDFEAFPGFSGGLYVG
jgi:cyclophilin family peptidyl-prolyl cis-trans isomerase